MPGRRWTSNRGYCRNGRDPRARSASLRGGTSSADGGCSTLRADTPLEVRLERGERDAESLDGLIHRLAGSDVLQELADTRRPDPIDERARRKGTFLVGDHRLRRVQPREAGV